MKFSKVIGYSDNPEVKKAILQAEEKLSAVFTELSLGYSNKSIGSGIGGDPLIFQLVYPLPHIADITSIQLKELKDKQTEIEKKVSAGGDLTEEEKNFNDEEVKNFRRKMGGRILTTAATDATRYYWSPEFVNNLSRMGLRIVVSHEAFHSIYMHPSRRGGRFPKLWNIAVDFKVNFTIMEDFKARELKDYTKIFTDNLGEYITLEEYAAFLRDPFNPPTRLAHLNPIINMREQADPGYVDPNGDKKPMYFAEPNLPEEMKRPENIYDYLLAQIPKCPKCGRLGKYKKNDEYKALEKKIKEREQKEKQKAKDKNNQKGEQSSAGNKGEECDDNSNSPADKQSNGQTGQGQSCCGDDGEQSCGCPECGGDDSAYVDPFGAGDTLDDHMDTDVSEDELNKRVYEATEAAKRMAGKIPHGLEEELGILTSPVIRWEDIVRQQMRKKRDGIGRKDYQRPKSRPLFAGLYVPKQKDFYLKICVAYDCSGSMSDDDIAYGISQLQVIDDRSEMSLVGFDTMPYFDKMVKLKKANRENLQNVKRVAAGGTMVGEVFNQYEEHCGKVDMIIVISDGFIYDIEFKDAKIPPKETSTLWLITSHNPNFKPPFGRVMHLKNERM